MSLDLTPSQTVGPYFALLLRSELQSACPAGLDGAVELSGLVTDGAGKPVEDTMIELWMADRSGHYLEVGESDGRREFTGFARFSTDDQGRYSTFVIKPGRVDSGRDGILQAPHIGASLFGRGILQRMVTRIYFPEEQAANSEDPVLRSLDPDRRPTLIAEQHGNGLRFDIRLQGEEETVFFDL